MKDKIVGGVRYLITQVIIPNVIWTALLGIPSAVFGIIYIVKGCQEFVAIGNVSPRTLAVAIVCVAICFLSLLFTVIYFFYQIHLNKQHTQGKGQEAHQAPPFPPIRTGYAIVRAEFELHFKDREHLLQRQKIMYRVEEENVDAIDHTIQWTGDGSGQTRLKQGSYNKGYRLKETKAGNVLCVQVQLPEKKGPGFTDSYTLETEVSDTEHQMLPILSRKIIAPTEWLCLKVTVPEGMIQDCERFVSVDFPPQHPLSEPITVEAESFGDNLCYQYEFKNPELLRYYILRWAFAENYPIAMPENSGE